MKNSCQMGKRTRISSSETDDKLYQQSKKRVINISSSESKELSNQQSEDSKHDVTSSQSNELLDQQSKMWLFLPSSCKSDESPNQSSLESNELSHQQSKKRATLSCSSESDEVSHEPSKKRLRLAASNVLQKCNIQVLGEHTVHGYKELSFEKDRFSELPDEIVVVILSRLTLKEAARTSVLSHRWEHLWKDFTGSFDFRPTKKVFRLLFMGATSIEEERRDYALWLKKVLSMHRGATLEEFKVRFCLDINFAHVIDSWLYFASRKAIRKLELDFRSFYNFSHFEYSYSIPLRAFSSNFKNLSSISLSSVDVTDEFLVCCLATCHLLEELRVLGATSLVHVEIVGPSLMLKHLDIVQCESLKHVEISANNLVSFKFHGPKINISLKSIPRLVEVSIESHYCEHLIAESCKVTELQSSAYANEFCQFFLRISQLEILKLRMNAEVGRFDYFHNCPPFTALKHLELRFKAYANRSLLFLNSLIDACPSLEKFVIKLSFIGTARNQQWDDVFENVRKTVGSPCHVLKVVEFIGFEGHFADMELAMNLILKAVCLERVSIDPHCVFLEDIDLNYEDESEYWDLEEIDLAREQSKLLAENIPPGIDLVII